MTRKELVKIMLNEKNSESRQMLGDITHLRILNAKAKEQTKEKQTLVFSH